VIQTHLSDGPFPFPIPKGVCQVDNTRVVQKPNRDNADLMISVLSHEDSETITDPIENILHSGWFAPSTPGGNVLGNEGGDNCELFTSANVPPGVGNNPDAYSPTLGGSARAGTLYTQLINGDRYYTQSEWSNGTGNCEMRPSGGRIVPRFTVPARPARVGASLRFNPSRSASRHGYSSATWRFGDGSQTAFFSGNAALTPATHVYSKAGRYTVMLTLVDARGNLQSTSRQVIVHRRRT
jgi:hypothetical protein